MKKQNQAFIAFRWVARTKNHSGQRILQHYVIVRHAFPLSYDICQCYPNTWDISSTIVSGMSHAQYESRLGRILERDDCEVA